MLRGGAVCQLPAHRHAAGTGAGAGSGGVAVHAPTPAPPAYAPPPTRAHAKEECAVCGRSTAADACSPWNVLTCDVHGCGNEVHTYCTLANPIETFACPACEAKPARHPSLDARIELQRAKDAEFKY